MDTQKTERQQRLRISWLKSSNFVIFEQKQDLKTINNKNKKI